MKNKKAGERKEQNSLIDRHGFDKLMGAFLAVKPKGKKQKPETKQKQKRRDIKK